MRSVSLVVSIGLLVGCDATEPASTRSVDVVVPLEAVTLHVGEVQEVDAAEHFRHSDGAALTFEAQRDSGRSVEVMPVDATRFRLEAQSEGRSVIEVKAAFGEGLQASATFAVHVAPGLCPPGPESGQTDYFPLEIGQVWTFEHRHRSGPAGAAGQVEGGQLLMEVESVACANRVRTVRVREVTVAESGTVRRQAIRTFTEDAANRLSLELPGGRVHFDADPYELPAFARYAAASGADTLVYRHGAQGDGILRVKRERGVVAWSWGACDPIWCESVGLVRVD